MPSFGMDSADNGSDGATHRLPPKLPCYGRKELTDRVVQLILADKPKAISILGGPAIGKTTVGNAAVYDPRLKEGFGRRRYFVACSEARTRAEVAGRIADSLNIPPSPYSEDAVLEAFESARAVLLLDDVHAPLETDREGVQELLSRLASVDGLALVVVLRGAERPARLEWEEPIQVGPFELDTARDAFLKAAGKRHANDPLLDSLLESTGFVPCAVMLLGRLAETEPDLNELRHQWDIERTKVLQAPGVSEDFRRMAASFEVSITALDDRARRLLSLLAWLPDGIAAQEVGQVLPEIGQAACKTLRRLALVFPNESRLRLHAVLAAYLRDKYPPHFEDWQHAVEHFGGLAIDEEARFGSCAGDQAVSRFAANLGNIEAVIARALHGERKGVAMEATAALAGYIALTDAGSRKLVEAALQLESLMTPHARARLLKNCADLERRHGQREQAQQRYAAACQIFDAIRDEGGAADCVKKMGDLFRERGDLKRAHAAYQAALRTQRKLKSRIGQAGCIAGLADVEMARGDRLNARSRFQDAFQLCQQAENHGGMAYCKTRLGYLSLDQEGFEEARVDFQQAVDLAGKAHDLLVEASALQGLAMAELACNITDGVEDRFRKALRFFWGVDDTFGMGGCLRGLGDLARNRLDNAQAWHHYQDALQIYLRGPHWPDVEQIHRRLMTIAETEEERQIYLAKAKQAQEKAMELAPAKV